MQLAWPLLGQGPSWESPQSRGLTGCQGQAQGLPAVRSRLSCVLSGNTREAPGESDGLLTRVQVSGQPSLRLGMGYASVLLDKPRR